MPHTPKSPVIDVEVTPYHIEHGKKSKCVECPVALAIRETYPKYLVSVGPYECQVGHFKYDLPQNVRAFICAFDLGCSVKPLKFTLEDGRPTTFWL